MKRQAITLGRIGIFLPVLLIIPFINFLASLAFVILLLISHHNFSKVYEKPEIFNKALVGTIVNIGSNLIGVIIVVVAVGATALSFSLQDPESFDVGEITGLIFGSGVTIAGALVILAGLIVGTYFIFKSLSTLAVESGVNLFKTAGLLYFIGAIALILFGLGGIVMFVGWILHIIAYFSIPYDAEAKAG